ncbi:MAG TPA: polyhydroxyalkanoate synthesis regulator DNA-binding domain-containing protein [Leptospiraceae bacterium]|nr:polyhydroxyalkanoate synthesis regulator DNA-binding domain-containing protein [Leptospiraceae bacterium]HMX55935.1 polyhydroxyalkanoate synthesis regulator DNA-binding domain-containing protein [Leptospiraceae bacterium]HMY47855.1 polyhydroxyalkanoate synthesis regulator DNA-binding domain-containing protein [Leptospiraceae bacterium]HNE24041.1 polyhydroxyalkanoate synthesis regulator DNA-binding domain-containing protein [Leptospiraceae bacterium]HNJ33466.1 polyhydroxyalkanoate synthesis r
MKKPILLKRYANRRLYDAETSRTLTLEDVAARIRSGHEIKVVENATGEDITAYILGQTFLKVSLDRDHPEFSSFLLTALIREISGNVSHFFHRLVRGGIGFDNLTRERMESIAARLVEKGELQIAERSEYVDRLMNQLHESRLDQIEKTTEAGKDRLREKLNRDDRIEELSVKLQELSGFLQDLRK